jgi:predicted dehydrogenase
VEVDARVDRQETRVDINACVLARFANGAMASLAIGGNSAANASHLAYIFEGGRIEVDGWGGGWLRAFDGKGAVQTPDVTIPEANPDAHFVDVIQGRAAPLYTPDDGVAHIRFMEALYASARDSRPVRLG